MNTFNYMNDIAFLCNLTKPKIAITKQKKEMSYFKNIIKNPFFKPKIKLLDTEEINYLKTLLEKQKKKPENLILTLVNYNIPSYIHHSQINRLIKCHSYGNLIRIYVEFKGYLIRLYDHLIFENIWYIYDKGKINDIIIVNNNIRSKFSVCELNSQSQKDGLEEKFDSSGKRVSVSFYQKDRKIHTIFI